jgi:hypothetical protein
MITKNILTICADFWRKNGILLENQCY